MSFVRRSLCALGVCVSWMLVVAPAQAEPPTVLYRLSGDSGFLSGCIEGPCLCPISFTLLGGTFGLTPAPGSAPQTYAISDIDWFTHWNGEVFGTIAGSGTYELDGENHRITLEIQFDGGSPILLDSGFVVRGSEFPAIRIGALTDTFCFQQGVILDAAPSAYSIDVTLSNANELTWTVVPETEGYDVVQGDLNMLRATGGAFDYASTACLADGIPGTSTVLETPVAPGEVVWFVVRGLPGPGYDSDGEGQIGTRDAEIDQSPHGCP